MSFLRFQRKVITDEEGKIVIQIKKLMKIKKERRFTQVMVSRFKRTRKGDGGQ
jgi:hypothetical protein